MAGRARQLLFSQEEGLEEYLGHRISDEGIRVDPRKIKVVVD